MITVPATFRAMPRWWHDRVGQDWLDRLPQLAADQCAHWQLELDGSPWHGSNALVVPVQRRGEPLALRLGPPGDDVEAEARALQLWDGCGTVRLFAVDVDRQTMLLERLNGDHTLADEPLDVAVPVLAELTRTLAVPVPSDVTSTSSVAAEHAEGFAPEWSERGEPTPRHLLAVAVAAARRLADRPTSGCAVDGDLHHEQVLAGRRAPWLVVDPLLLRGDPEYDLGRVLWSRLEELPTRADVLAAFDTFVEAAAVPTDRARDWVLVRSMSYLLWGLGQGLTVDPPKCRRLLDLFG